MPHPHVIQIGSRVEFAPNPRWPSAKLRGQVVRWRPDPRGGPMGWLDVSCEDGVERSVRPNGCERLG